MMPHLGIEAVLESKERQLYYKYAVLKEKLLTEAYTRWAQGFPEGNDHGPGHIGRVLEKLDQLVGPNPVETSMRSHELYLAMMSILYHDIGILQSRKNHPDKASKFLGEKISGTPYFMHDEDNFLFDLHDRDVIRAAVVSHSSSKDINNECQSFPHEIAIASHVIRPRFIAALVRLADELDEDYRRAPQLAEQLTQLPEESHFYWRFCQRISGIRAKRDLQRITIDAKFERQDVGHSLKVNKNDQLFVAAFADKLAKVNKERRYTNQFLPADLKYDQLVVNVRPLDDHGTWVNPRTFTFADGTSAADFLNAFPELSTNMKGGRGDNENPKSREVQILKDLDAIASDVMAAVQGQPHGVKNKDKWVSRLQQFATQYDDILGPIAGCVKRISYKIEDSTFDHANLGTPPYCCDQVEEDLAFLRLCILPIVAKGFGWDSGRLEKEEKQLLETIWVNFHGIVPPPLPPGTHPDMTDEELRQAFEGWDAGNAYAEYKAQQLNQWHAEWKAYQFKIGTGENLAMARYVNDERKRS